MNLAHVKHAEEMRRSLHNMHQANVQGLVSNLYLLNLKGSKKLKRHNRKIAKLAPPRKAAKRLQLKVLKVKRRQQPLAKRKSRLHLAKLPRTRVRVVAERNPKISATS